MEQPGQSSSSSVSSHSQSASTGHCRNVWIVTAYGISGLIVFGVLAYYISSYVTH